MKVYLNGQMVDQLDARISINDAGFQHAVGLFETMGVYHGRVFRLQAHIDRLVGSARMLGLSRTLDPARLRHAIELTIEQNQLQQARVRLTVTGGEIPMLSPKDEARDAAYEPTVLVVASEPVQYDPAYFEQGVMAMIAGPVDHPFDLAAGHKTLAYWSRLRRLRQAATAGAGEVIGLNVTNHLTSGAVSNVFLVKDGQLFTPFARGEEVEGALPAPVLPGTTRAAILTQAKSMGLTGHLRMLSIEDLLAADEVFLTNASWRVLPVTRIEKHPVGDGRVGPLTQQMRTALFEQIDQETSAPTTEGFT